MDVMNEKRCCLAVLDGLANAGKACLALHEVGSSKLFISILRRPGDKDERTNVFRVPSIGAVLCDGPLTEVLTAQLEQQRRALSLGDGGGSGAAEDAALLVFLQHLGVPATRYTPYEQALKIGHILMILQGAEEALRRACEALRVISVDEPILYFG